MKDNKEPTARQVRSEANRECIANTALELFQKYGYEATTIQDICTATGFSVGTFYHYYKSKDDLLELVCKRVEVAGELMEDTAEKIKDPLLPIYQFLLDYAATWMQIGPEMAGQIYRIFDRMYLNEDRTLRSIQSRRELTQFIAAAQAIGNFDDSMPAAEAADYFLLIGRGLLYEWYLRQASYSLVEATAKFMPRIVNTFGRGNAKPVQYSTEMVAAWSRKSKERIEVIDARAGACS